MSADRLLPRLSLLLLLTAVLPASLAWGPIGHSTVALVAQPLLTKTSQRWLLYYLPETAGQLEPIASWADQVRATTQPWNRPLHGAFTPWYSGQYVFSRDCWSNKTTSDWLGGCVDGAMMNYTHRLANTAGVNFTQRVEALKYIVHFVGDISQPLHGGFWDDHSGDLTTGRWFGNATTLHAVWDRGIIDRRVNTDYGGNATLFSQSLVQRSRQRHADFPAWLNCSASVSGSPWNACSDLWLTESNRLCISNVYRYNATGPAFNASTGFDIREDSHYYQFNLPIVEYQIMRAGVRLADVINRLLNASLSSAFVPRDREVRQRSH